MRKNPKGPPSCDPKRASPQKLDPDFGPKPGQGLGRGAALAAGARRAGNWGVLKGGEGVKAAVGPVGSRSRPTALFWGRTGRGDRGCLGPERCRRCPGSPAEKSAGRGAPAAAPKESRRP